ncbi:TonB-dependent receptor plug domain-containing protein [Helicobacter saguini]|uniref:TonB-dependent receptor plug domain-containing protein n=1 Tax=Helicobacter saguini TaxID=1548018 RepID=A0A6L7D9L6_9HELI|nr:TonB-dependent receptor plug domain-containing protein [Helicobacter saguini]
MYIYIYITIFFSFNILDSKENIESKATIEEKDSNAAQSIQDFNHTNKIYKLNAITAFSGDNLNKFQSSNGVINRQMIESNPSGNGDITSLLRILPNIQYDNNQLSSNTPGEISPANISISGGLFYQNNFQLDGFNMNNDLDPAASLANTQNMETSKSMYGRSIGRSQGLAIDISLLDSIIVQDSNISASYGKFTGGLIQANTRKATKKFGAKISYQISQGDARANHISLTNYHVYGNLNDFINSSYSTNQPRFIKHIFRSSFESKFNDNAGIIASFTTTQSFIPLRGYDGDSTNVLDIVEKTQSRQNYNVFIKGYYDINESFSIESSYTYAPEFNKYFIINAKDSDFFYDSGGHNLGVKSIWNNALGNLNAQINFSYLEDSRTKSANDYKVWLYSSEKNWSNNSLGVEEGGYGNVDNKQISSEFRLTQDFEPLNFFRFWQNRFLAGLELGYGYSYFKRHNDVRISNNGTIIAMPQGQTCVDYNWCTNIAPSDTTLTDFFGNDLSNGYYFGYLNYLKAGEISLHNFTFSTFLEDSMSFNLGDSNGVLDVRFGLRLDYELYMNKAPIAPRLAITYEAPWNTKNSIKDFASQITFGYNRYYGRNIFAYRLMDGQAKLDVQYWKMNLNTFDPNDNISESTPYTQGYVIENGGVDTNFLGLRVPYDDELMIGFIQQILAFKLNVKYIHRFGRDQVNTKNIGQDAQGNTRYAWANEGRSDSDIISIFINNDKPLEIFNISNFITFGFDFTHLKRNFNSYSNIFTNAMNNQIISYNGQFIRYIDRPAENFFRPYTFRITTTHSFNIWKTKILINNFFRFRSSYDAMVAVEEDLQDSYNGAKVPTFRIFKVPSSFTWDMRFGFEIDVFKNNNVFVNLDIFNILDSKNISILNLSAFSSSASATAIPTYEVGRSFWLEVGYRF